MAMEIGGSLPDYVIRKQNYTSYAAQGMAGNSAAGSTKKKETEKTQETTGSSKSKSVAEYANELARLVPSVKFRIGNACVSDKSGKSLTINPQLLEKMQNDPEKEKDMRDMIKGVESMSKLAASIAKASGWTIVYQHSYMDENGKYHCRMQTRNDLMLNMSAKLREERRKISEKLIEKSKEKAAEKKEKLEEILEEKKAAATEEGTAGKASDESAYNRAEELINEKMAASKDGTIYLDDIDIRAIVGAVQEEGADKTIVNDQTQAGPKLDLKI